MTVKSIIELELDQQTFARFLPLWEKYNEALKKSPAFWKQTNQAAKSTSAELQKSMAGLLAQSQTMRVINEAQRSQNRQLQQADRFWVSMGRSTKSVAENIFSATRSLLGWSGLLGLGAGLLGAGSLFGLTRLATTAGDERRSSSGLGMSIGQQRAFQINFSRLVNPDAFLGWVNEMETDPTKAWSAAAMGVKTTGNTEADAVQMLKALRARAQSTPTSMLGMLPKQFGLSGISTEELRRLQGMPSAEFGELIAGNARDIGKTNISDDVAKKWQDLTKTLEEAKSSIYATLVKGLVPLAGPLGHLSESVTKFIGVLLKSDMVNHAIEGLAHWMESFSGTISAPKFLDDVKRFTSDIGALAEAVHNIAWGVSAIFDLPGNVRKFFFPNAGDLKESPKLFDTYLGRLDTHFGLQSGLLETIKGLEKSGATDVSRKGAVGMFQLMPGTAKQYGATDPTDPVQSANAAAKFLSHLEDKYQGDLAKVIAAYNAGEGRVDQAVTQAGKTRTSWYSNLPPETRQYLLNSSPLMQANGGIRIEINNNTGGSVTAAASQLAH